MQFAVTFSANLYVEVTARDERAARRKATKIATQRAREFSDETVQTTDWINIHPDDITRVDKVG